MKEQPVMCSAAADSFQSDVCLSRCRSLTVIFLAKQETVLYRFRANSCQPISDFNVHVLSCHLSIQMYTSQFIPSRHAAFKGRQCSLTKDRALSCRSTKGMVGIFVQSSPTILFSQRNKAAAAAIELTKLNRIVPIPTISYYVRFIFNSM